MGFESKCPNRDDLDALAHLVYPFCPNLGAAFFFCVVFGLVTITHIVQAIIYRKKYCWVIAMAAAWETVGFGTRIAGTQHQDSRDPLSGPLFTISTVFVLIAPIWLNAFVYMTFGRMVHYFLPDRKVARISARYLTLMFVILDITAFIIQVIGALMLSGQDVPQQTLDNGLHTYIFGVAFQEAFILAFLGLSVAFWKKAKNGPAHRQERWDILLIVIWVALVLITVRIMYRIAEYAQGFDSYGATHEWLEYVWDALPMFTAMLMFNLYHPSKALKGPESEFPKLTRQQKKELKAAKKADKEAQRQAESAGSAEYVPLNDRVSNTSYV